jgi:4-hydroxy-tetrahydrodipicolinate synthase
VIFRVVERTRGRVPVLAGTGSNSTKKTVAASKAAVAAGAQGVMIVTPYYNKPSQDGMRAHFLEVAAAVDVPIVIYNIPPRSVIDMTVETMARLAELPNIIGVKDATADLTRPVRTRLAISKPFCQLSGEDGTALGFNAHGGVGCISVTANIAPRLCAEFQNACTKGDYAKARELHERLMPLHETLFCETSPSPVKYAASLLGKCEETVRLPLAPLSESSKAKVRAAMTKAGLLN